MKRFKATVYDRTTGMKVEETSSCDSYEQAVNEGHEIGEDWPYSYRLDVEEEGNSEGDGLSV